MNQHLSNKSFKPSYVQKPERKTISSKVADFFFAVAVLILFGFIGVMLAWRG